MWVFFKNSKKNERVRWIEDRVINSEQHGVKCRRENKGPAMTVAYEHMRMAPKRNLAEELFSRTLEDELYTEQISDVDGTSESLLTRPNEIHTLRPRP